MTHVMPTADSIADETQLRLALRRRLTQQWGAVRMQISDARYHGLAAKGYTLDALDELVLGIEGTPSEGWTAADVAGYHAELSARAAFRAVPALRVPDFESEADR